MKIFLNPQIQRQSYLLSPVNPTALTGPDDEDAMLELGEGTHNLDLETVPAAAGTDYRSLMLGACALIVVMTCVSGCACWVRATRRWVRSNALNAHCSCPLFCGFMRRTYIPSEQASISCSPVDRGGNGVIRTGLKDPKVESPRTINAEKFCAKFD